MGWIFAGLAAASAGDSVERTFDCNTAPQVLGEPAGTVELCQRVYHTPNLWFIRLKVPTGGVASRLVLVDDTGPFAGLGLAALGRFLEESGLDAEKALTQGSLQWYVKAAQAFPPGWSEMDGAGQIPGIGAATTFRAAPIELVLYRRRDAAPIGRPGTLGRPPPGQFDGPVERAVLARDASGGFSWSIAVRSGTGWVEGPVYPLR
jgi:hypothetical protein